jgi:hypothetical protein
MIRLAHRAALGTELILLAVRGTCSSATRPPGEGMLAYSAFDKISGKTLASVESLSQQRKLAIPHRKIGTDPPPIRVQPNGGRSERY